MAYLLDTSALLAHYRDEPGAERVQALFDEDNSELLLASVSLPELARRLKDLGASPDEARNVVRQYAETLDEIVPVDQQVAEMSFDLICRLPARLPLVDALIAAAAMSRQATLVHRDAHMRAIPAKLLAQLDLDTSSTPG
ncbi:MAG: PIN domain-containing protein [Luteolibacter sp.]|jgi:predicted nucleic acid-binding protein|nr:PIN domain-containing protein [Luteolibacter sp.]